MGVITYPCPNLAAGLANLYQSGAPGIISGIPWTCIPLILILSCVFLFPALVFFFLAEWQVGLIITWSGMKPCCMYHSNNWSRIYIWIWTHRIPGPHKWAIWFEEYFRVNIKRYHILSDVSCSHITIYCSQHKNNKSNVKHQNTLGCLDQYMCRGLRLKQSGQWNSFGK